MGEPPERLWWSSIWLRARSISGSAEPRIVDAVRTFGLDDRVVHLHDDHSFDVPA